MREWFSEIGEVVAVRPFAEHAVSWSVRVALMPVVPICMKLRVPFAALRLLQAMLRAEAQDAAKLRGHLTHCKPS